MTEHDNSKDAQFQLYQKIADRMNAKLQIGKVTVIRTDNMSKFCDAVSLEMNDELFLAIHQDHDSETIKVVFDGTYKINNREYYIEPYNKYLLNIAF